MRPIGCRDFLGPHDWVLLHPQNQCGHVRAGPSEDFQSTAGFPTISSPLLCSRASDWGPLSTLCSIW